MSELKSINIDSFKKEEEERLVKYLSNKYSIPYIDGNISVDPPALLLVKEEEARAAQCAFFKKVGKTLSLATRKPNDSKTLLLIAGVERNGYVVKKYFASINTLEKIFNYYSEFKKTERTRLGVVQVSGERISEIRSQIKTPEDFEKLFGNLYTDVSQTETSALVENVISVALSLGASDIHIEPFKEEVDMRLRIDGVLVKVLTASHEISNKIVNRFKLISGMKINLNKIAQDGRFTLQLANGDVEFRVSLVPTSFGESLVMRLLDPSKDAAVLSSIGLHPDLLAICKREIHKPNGMLITTGPTGSGKTTSLYSFIREIQTPDKKIFTLENPVEYKLRGIVQTQIEKGYSFIDGLKAALRQDPDIILVGEIRAEDVAKTAFDAALTGHFVFSTLHTNDAAGALPRLVGLGIDPKILSSAMNLILAQRLVRKICKNCKELYAPTEVEVSEMRKIIEEAPEKMKNELTSIGFDGIYKTKEKPFCSECFGGYKGVIGTFEAILVTKDLERIITNGGGISDLKEEAKKNGFATMQQDCLLKVFQGITTINELDRTTGSAIKTS